MSASWIHRLNESDSRLHKENVLKEALSLATLGDQNSQIFLSLTNKTYNPFVTFGVKQVPKTEGVVGAENPWHDFNDLLTNLSKRNITGNAAKFAIEQMSNRFDSEEWNGFCSAVIKKDLRSGISDKTINKVVKGTQYTIPIFGCQLAASSEDRPEMIGMKRIEPKLDGVRVLLFAIPGDNGEVTTVSYSRNGKIFENFKHIEDQIAEKFNLLTKKHRAMFSSGVVFDGEVVGESFQALMRQARRKENVQSTDSVFSVFDIIPVSDFLNGFWNAKLAYRINLLEEMRTVIDEMPSVELLPHIMVNLDFAEGKDQLHRYATDMVAAGFEGVMIKSIAAPYECKRNTFWLKWKPVITVDLEVADVEEGTGRNLGRLGALVCAGSDHGKDITVNVGSGFSDVERDNFWLDRNLVIGRKVEILCDVITQNRDGTYSLRFPRFVRFRDDK